MATKYGAYTGKVIKVDLTTQTVEEYPLNDRDRRLFLGGKVLAARIISDFVKGPIDPFSPENPVVVTNCPLTGTMAPCSSRFNISTISPLTGILSSSNCGGNFGLKLKKAGYDALIIVGKSESLIYLEILEDKISFKDAKHLKNKTTGETQELIVGKTLGKLVIGPAGENLVRYACAVSEERAAGRGGIGAVMGSKNLKAIVADGKVNIPIYNADKFNKLRKNWTVYLTKHPITGEQLPKLGTAALLAPMQQKHILATKNFSTGQFEGFRNITGEELAEKHLVRNKGCMTCPIQCGRVCQVDGKNVKGPEVEALGLLGANIMNDDLEKIIRWNYELDELGMDAISAAGTLAFSMELNEKGLWNSGVSFGQIDNISKRFEEIAFRSTPEGDEMANGSRYLSKKYGGEDFCMQAKGMEFAAYEPRGAVGQGLGYAVSNRGGCHLNAGYMVVIEGLGLTINPYTTRGKAQLSIFLQNVMEAASAGGSCLFTTYAVFPGFLYSKPNSLITRTVNKVFPYLGPVMGLVNRWPGLLQINLAFLVPHAAMIKHATGMRMNIGEFLKFGARGFNLERKINERLGIDAKDDHLPKRITDELQLSDNPKSRVPLAKMKKQFYRARGWDKNGNIKKRTLRYYSIREKDLDEIVIRPLEQQGEVKVIPPKKKKPKKAKSAPKKETTKKEIAKALPKKDNNTKETVAKKEPKDLSPKEGNSKGSVANKEPKDLPSKEDNSKDSVTNKEPIDLPPKDVSKKEIAEKTEDKND